jgi:hypothetical protein
VSWMPYFQECGVAHIRLTEFCGVVTLYTVRARRAVVHNMACCRMAHYNWFYAANGAFIQCTV